jgi:hypothetical protein
LATSIHGYQWLEVGDYLSLVPSKAGEPVYPNDFYVRLKQGSSSKQLLKLSTTWGISHLGYHSPAARRTLTLTAKGAAASLLSIVSSTWDLKTISNSQQEYFISVWKPDLSSFDSAARVSVVSREKSMKKTLPFLAHRNDSYFNPKTGRLNPHYSYDPLALQGLPLWTEEVSSLAGFAAALEKADNLMRSPQELEILLALLQGNSPRLSSQS